MKKTLLLISISLFINVLFINAQDSSKSLMDLQAFEKSKQEFIIKESGLTEEEAQKFFPLNSELQRKKLELHRRLKDLMSKTERSDNLSDDEYEQLNQEIINIKIEEAELDKEYADKFNKMMSPQKLFKAHQAERTFMQEELRKFREANKNGRITTGKRH